MIERPVIDEIKASRATGRSISGLLVVQILISTEIIVPGLLQAGKLILIGLIFSLVLFGGFAGVLVFSYGYLRLWSWLLQFFHFD